MKKRLSLRISAFSLLCVLLIIVLLFLQCGTTFWTYGKDKSVSLQGYIWFPADHSALNKQLNADLGLTGNFNPSSILLFPVLTLLTGAVGVVLGLLFSDRLISAILPILCGASAIVGYIIKPALQLGINWQLHLAAAVLLVLAGVVHLIKLLKATDDE